MHNNIDNNVYICFYDLELELEVESSPFCWLVSCVIPVTIVFNWSSIVDLKLSMQISIEHGC